jgi:hypothetical protein
VAQHFFIAVAIVITADHTIAVVVGSDSTN